MGQHEQNNAPDILLGLTAQGAGDVCCLSHRQHLRGTWWRCPLVNLGKTRAYNCTWKGYWIVFRLV